MPHRMPSGLPPTFQLLVGAFVNISATNWAPCRTRMWIRTMCSIKAVLAFKRRMKVHREQSKARREELLEDMLQFWKASEKRKHDQCRKAIRVCVRGECSAEGVHPAAERWP